jgi:hypothetical protein
MKQFPDDDASRMEPGRNQIKCGLYGDAARNLPAASMGTRPAAAD